ncbi:crossover junction endodeoxyribonuclease RuvC [Peptoniphilus equinus]|uniref:Crossover junction endodeoxyribonuclease RuvC n=1 Tax=Peptoniphilus equinus TaxID=3016343 RepID=A0ABY7QV36_9FIRM|nr:crossover junction endodeoxyribonuclease RuvC [Peptoniphilus equinus]WBW50642.1 crossover junction endodeoxyribonuclease RuvC [Peptoniphilus equinus]
MKILGIDPGYAIVGYGIIQVEGNKLTPLGYGSIVTDKDLTFPERLEKIYRELSEIILHYQPDDIAFEELFFNKNITTGIAVAEARGVEMLVCKMGRDYLYEYTPLQIKNALVGYGRAEKHQVQEMVKMLLGLDAIPKPDDTADALAVAITHSASLKFKDQFRMK